MRRLLLLVHGFDPQGLDGFFGVNTDTAIKVSAAKGLPVNGIIDAKVWLALEAEPRQ